MDNSRFNLFVDTMFITINDTRSDEKNNSVLEGTQPNNQPYKAAQFV